MYGLVWTIWCQEQLVTEKKFKPFMALFSAIIADCVCCFLFVFSILFFSPSLPLYLADWAPVKRR